MSTTRSTPNPSNKDESTSRIKTVYITQKASVEIEEAVEQACFTAAAITQPPSISIATHTVKSSYNAYWEKVWADRKEKKDKESNKKENNRNVSEEENPFADLSDHGDSCCAIL